MNADGGADPYRTKVIELHADKLGRSLRIAIYFFLFGLFGLLPLKSFLDWFAGGPMPHAISFEISALLIFVPVGILFAVNALRGLPSLVVTPDGVKLKTTFGTQWAKWDSLEPFTTREIGKTLLATAKIIGPNVRKVAFWQQRFTIPNHFKTPLAAIVVELNAVRANALGISAPLAGTAESPGDTRTLNDATVGLAKFKLPWVSFALLALLIAAFTLENVFAVTPATDFTASVPTLFALGGLSRTAVLSAGEWYRLFTAPLLHLNLPHLIGNSIALLFGGWTFERLVGRLWFFAVFAVGAIGGSLLSLAVAPPNLISVGASGALMGIFAALLVCGFRLPEGTTARRSQQMRSLRILIPSLLPLFSASPIHIDYGAHFGGAIAGAAIALPLLKFWPESARIPQLRAAAAAIAIVSGVLFAVSAGFAAFNYSKYDVAVIPQTELPKTPAEGRERAAALVARYPNDPRSHFYLAEALASAKDNAGAERELRLALAAAGAHVPVFGVRAQFVAEGSLALFLLEQGKQDEAKDLAHGVCSALSEEKSTANLVKLLSAKSLCD